MHHRLITIMVALISLLVIATILVINTTQREHNYKINQIGTQRILTQSAVTSIRNLINSREAQVQLFADTNLSLLSQLLQHPDDDALYEQLLTLLQQRMPTGFLTFSIASEQGQVIIQPFDKQVGDVCISDIKAFSKNITNHGAYTINPVFIHPQPGAYHYDIMASIKTFPSKAILLVSFSPDQFVSLLKQHEIPGFQLIVSNSRNKGLVEFTSEGYRSQASVPFHISEEEMQATHSSQPVPDTLWRVYTVADADYDDSYLNDLWIEALYIFLIFSGGGLIILFIVGKGQKQP